MAEENKKKDKPVTRQDLEQILDKLLNKPEQQTTQNNAVNTGIQQPYSQYTPEDQMYIPQNQPQPAPQMRPPLPKLTPQQEKRVIAQQVLKLHKSIIILCLICFIFPMIIALVAMMDPMMALVVAIFSIIYPALLYSKSVKAQEYLSQKYNLKPFTPFKQPRRQPPINQQGEFF